MRALYVPHPTPAHNRLFKYQGYAQMSAGGCETVLSGNLCSAPSVTFGANVNLYLQPCHIKHA